MKSVEFKQVGMQNYCLFIEPMELLFEENKTVLITGPNGVGKSSIFDCLPFTLYGVTSKGAHGDDVVNNIVGKDCHTWLTFNIDGVPHRVDRYHKHRKFGNTVVLNIDGEDVKKGQREVLPEIERILVPQKLFMNTLLFGQKVKDFFTDLTDTQKKEIFRKILQLDNYVLYYKEADLQIENLARKVLDISNSLGVKTQVLGDVRIQVGVLTQAKDKFEEERSQQVLSLNSTLKQLLEEHNRVVQDRKVKEEHVSAFGDIDKIVNDLEQNIRSVDTNLGTIYQEIRTKKQLKESELRSEATKAKVDIDSKYQQLEGEIKDKYRTEENEIEKNIAKNDIELNKKKEEIKSIQFHRGLILNENTDLKENIIDKDVATCPTCQQTISPETLQKLKDKMEHNRQKNESLRIEIVDKEDIIVVLAHRTINLNLKIENILEAKSKYLQDLAFNKALELQKVQSRLDKLLDQLETRAAGQLEESTSFTINQKKILETKKQELEQRKHEQEQILEQIVELGNLLVRVDSDIKVNEDRLKQKKEEQYDDTQLKLYKERVKSLNNEIKELEKEGTNYQTESIVLEFWKVGFSSSGIPSLLTDESIPFMNQRMLTYMDQISNGRYIVSFDTLKATKAGEFRDKISVNVIDNLTKADSRVKLSGGQTRLVDIATILTLCDLQSSVQDIEFNIIMFDEIFDSLDDENIGYVSKLLRQLVVDKSVLIISHRHIDQIEADEVLNFY